MNILNVIEDCISNPFLLKDYEVEEFTIGQISDTQTITDRSAFSGFSLMKKSPINNKPSTLNQQLIRIYMRVWSALGKIITKAVTNGNCFVDLTLGYFCPSNEFSGRFIYSPSMNVLDRYSLSLKSNLYNIHPTTFLV